MEVNVPFDRGSLISVAVPVIGNWTDNKKLILYWMQKKYALFLFICIAVSVIKKGALESH
jgi:hypothetical protein